MFSKKVKLICLLILLNFSVTSVAFAFVYETGTISSTQTIKKAWYDPNWQYRKQITIDSTKVSNNLTDFPVLINQNSDINLASHARSDGWDIVFTSSDKKTKLNHEIETYNSTSGKLVAWVNVPVLSSTSNTTLYMYYGYPTSSNQQNSSNVWSSFQSIWHLKENPAATAPQVQDSTSNNRGATSVGGMASMQQVDGKIDGSLNFDGSNDGLDIASFSIGANFTYEAWVNAAIVTGGNGFRDIMTNYNYNRWLGLGTNGGSSGIIDFYDGTDSYFGTALSTNTWYHIVATYDGTNLRVYRNGNLLGTLAKSYSAQNSTFHIGYSKSISAEYFNGMIDEVRVSNIIRSQAWIITEYNNQNSPNTFYNIASEITK
jgi:hypothetical protein